MSASWNGLDLQTELSALLGDTSSTFKTRVSGWINDIQSDIANRHDWNFLIHKAEKLLTIGQEQQSVITAPPSAPSVALASGGSLVDGSSYVVYVTFVESNGLETIAGTASAASLPTGANLSIDLTSIPVSGESLVTKRKIYLQKDSGDVLFSATINDNVTTTASITADATSTIEAPDSHGVRKYVGNPFIESSSQLRLQSIDQMRLEYQGTFSSGVPSQWSPLGNAQMLFFPNPSSASTLSYYFQIRPTRIYAEVLSQPIIPIEFKQVLKEGVIAMGFEYRERAGQESKRSNYEELLKRAITDFGGQTRNISVIRDVIGDSEGYSTSEL